MTELTKPNEEPKPAQSLINPEHADLVAETKVPTSFIPEMKVTYQTSKAFKEEKAKRGDFFLDETSYGPEINVIALGYNYQAIARNDAGDFIDKIIFPQGNVSFKNNPLFDEFEQKNKGMNIEKGLLILMYLVDKNLWCVLFAKKALVDGGIDILNKAANRRVLTVTTQKEENQKKTREWYTLKVKDTMKNIPALKDEEEKRELFKKDIMQLASPEEVKATSRDR